MDDPTTPIPLSQTCVEAVATFRSSSGRQVFQFRFHPSCSHYVQTRFWWAGGAYLLDLRVSCVWSGEAPQEHITVLYMRAVKLALAAFLPWLISQCVILMSDNGSVIAYFRYQGSTVSWRLCMMAFTITQGPSVIQFSRRLGAFLIRRTFWPIS